MDSAAAATDLNQQGSRGPGVNVTFSGDAEWEIPRANLNVEKVIGRGAFGVVSRAMAWDLPGRPGWSLVAVKSVQGTLIFLTYTTYNGTPLFGHRLNVDISYYEQYSCYTYTSSYILLNINPLNKDTP